MHEKNSFINFLKYNNTVPIILGILFLGTTGAAAASPEVRGAIYSSNEVVASIDNSRIVSVNVSSYPLQVQITGVREDNDNYYLSYTLTTIDLVDGVWQDVAKGSEMTVAKALLIGKDLGTYASGELAEIRDAERRRLQETQEIEKKLGISSKVVATVYSGLIGQMLSSTEESFPGYTPVVDESEYDASKNDANRLETPVLAPTYDPNAPAPTSSSEEDPEEEEEQDEDDGSGADTTAPAIEIIGDNPARVALGESYTDLGALATDNQSEEPTIEISVDDVVVATVSIDTSVLGSYTITYRATDEAGNTRARSRTVTVYDPSVPEPEPTPEPVEPPEEEPVPEPDPVPQPTPEPEPEPEPTPEPEPVETPAS